VHLPASCRVPRVLTPLFPRHKFGRESPIGSCLARSLAIGSEHTVIRCRLDFLTNRQLRKLRTLAELRLAAVSSLQHCAITLVRHTHSHSPVAAPLLSLRFLT